jgi:hypothetical protein
MPHVPDIRNHETHDPELIAAYAAGDATGEALDTAAALVAGCPACAELHRDLRSIAAALPAMPAPVRPRDFRLSAGTAASLRPSGWRGLAALLAGPRFRLAAPLGTGLAALGLVGLLVGSGGLPFAGSGSATSASAPAAAGAAAASPASAAAGGAGDGAAPAELPAVVVPEAASAAPSAGPVTTPAASSASSSAAALADASPAASPDNRYQVDTASRPTPVPERTVVSGTSKGEGTPTAVTIDQSTNAEEALATAQSPDLLPLALAGGLLMVGLALVGLRVLARGVAGARR